MAGGGPRAGGGVWGRDGEAGGRTVSNAAIPHAGLRVLPAVFPSSCPFRCRRFKRRLLLRRLNRNKELSWRYQLPPCASCSKPAFTLAIIPAGGTPKWRHTFSVSATGSTSSISSRPNRCWRSMMWIPLRRSEEHTSELQSHLNLVCRLLLEKKKYTPPPHPHPKSVLPLVLSKPHQYRSVRQVCR